MQMICQKARDGVCTIECPHSKSHDDLGCAYTEKPFSGMGSMCYWSKCVPVVPEKTICQRADKQEDGNCLNNPYSSPCRHMVKHETGKDCEYFHSVCGIDCWDKKCEPYKAPKEKPPLGLTPKFLKDEQRVREIEAAISRYHAREIAVPKEWLKELNTLGRNSEPPFVETVYLGGDAPGESRRYTRYVRKTDRRGMLIVPQVEIEVKEGNNTICFDKNATELLRDQLKKWEQE